MEDKNLINEKDEIQNQYENLKTIPNNKRVNINFDEKLNDVLYKRALGYSSEEIIEEFQDDNGNLKLIKRKVTKKDIPPDITAVKILLEKKGEEELDLSSMSDEELENLRNEVMLKILKTQNEET